MIVFWRGYGWAVPVIVIGTLAIFQLSLNFFFGDGYYESNEWPKTAAFIISVPLIGGLGYILNYKKRAVVEDENTGETRKAKPHSFFLIPIEY